MFDYLKALLLIILLLPSWLLFSQTYEVGESYFDSNNYVEYIHGNLPLILSSPHGGEKKPIGIPDRDCNGCVTQNDTNTQELTREVAEAIHQIIGCYPHVIINRLHRSKLDANRAIEEAADGNIEAEQAWMAYNEFISYSDSVIIQNFQKGLFLDIHGHGHTIQRLELGYLLSKSNLQQADAILNEEQFVEKSSIKNLVYTNPLMLNLTELIRSEYSLGSIMYNKGYNSVPSNEDPFPAPNDSFFSGGYNTAQNGSRDEGFVDAIQIECNQDVRFETAPRQEFADSLALAIVEFLELHYFPNPELFNCAITSTKNSAEISEIKIYPNPANEKITIEGLSEKTVIAIYNNYGKNLSSYVVEEPTCQLDLEAFTNGIYILRVISNSINYSQKIYLYK